MKFVLDKEKILEKAREILGNDYVSDIQIRIVNEFVLIRVLYNSVILKHELKQLDLFFGKEWSNISHIHDYNEILYIINKSDIIIPEPIIPDIPNPIPGEDDEDDEDSDDYRIDYDECQQDNIALGE